MSGAFKASSKGDRRGGKGVKGGVKKFGGKGGKGKAPRPGKSKRK